MLEAISLWMSQNTELTILISLSSLGLALFFKIKLKGIQSAEWIIENQDKPAPREFLIEFREEAEKEDCLTQFNSAISDKPVPLTIGSVILSFEQAKKAIGKESIIKD